MRIKEFAIRNYGPLSDSGVIRLNNFNLFFGENEDGKTLTLEAMIRMLLGKGRKIFSGVERVSDKPDAYLIIENVAGKEYKLPESGQITDLIGLSAEEYRNLFIIRNSDLSIARESEFYGNVTERLTGIRTNQIQAIKTKLKSIGWFTDGLDILNNKESNYLKTRLKQAEALIEECDEMLLRAQAEGHEALEDTLVKVQKRCQEVEEEIGALEKARLREKYETGHRHLDTIDSLLGKLDKLKKINEEELRRWEEAERIIEESEKERVEALGQIKDYQQEKEEEETKLIEYQNQMRITRKKKADIDEVIKPLLRRWGAVKEDFARINAGKMFFRVVTALFLILSLSALGLLFWERHFFLMIAAIAAGTITFGLALFYYFRFIKPQGRLKQLERQIHHQAGEVGAQGDSIEQIQSQIQRFEENFDHQQQRIATLEGRIAFLENNNKSLKEEKLVEIDKHIREAGETLRVLQKKHNFQAVEIYRDRLRQRREYEQELKESITILKSLFGVKAETIPQCIQYWRAEIDELATYQNLAADTRFDEKKLDHKRTEQIQLQDDIEKMQRQMRDFEDELKELQRRANEVLPPDEIQEHFPCRTLNDLRLLRQQLNDFLVKVENTQRVVRISLEIFEEIERDEKQKVSKLFGDRSNVTRYYNDITEGLYPAVYYESEVASIKVKRRDGKFLQPAMLSSGAYDQLYFVIRLSLGEKLLPNEKGFFIFDDPFVKSDSERLKRQLELLVEISQQGWQIVYFSAKDEVRDALQKYVDGNQVTLQPVAGVEFK